MKYVFEKKKKAVSVLSVLFKGMYLFIYLLGLVSTLVWLMPGVWGCSLLFQWVTEEEKEGREPGASCAGC